MLYTLGARATYSEVADLLIGCHHRIRETLALARRIAIAAPSASISRESVRAAAARVRRYFVEDFPVHQVDEEEDLFPLLAGRRDTVDVALVRLRAEHAAVDADVAKLVSLCTVLEHDPSQLAALAAELCQLVDGLDAMLVAHLRFEEHHLFPAIELLSARERENLVARMRARRERR